MTCNIHSEYIISAQVRHATLKYVHDLGSGSLDCKSWHPSKFSLVVQIIMADSRLASSGQLHTTTSVTRLGDFESSWLTNILPKVAQMYCDVLGSYEKHYFLSKICCGNFWATLGKIWGYFLFQHLITLFTIYYLLVFVAIFRHFLTRRNFCVYEML